MEFDSMGANIVQEEGKFFRIEDGKKEEVEFIPGRGWFTQEELDERRQTSMHLSP